MSCECNNPENIIFGKTSVNVRCMDKGVYTGKYFGLHTTDESCCDSSENPIYVETNKLSSNCIVKAVYVGKSSDLENITDAVPEAGQIVVYVSDSYVFIGFKIGDGSTALGSLPFATFK